ncbi:MFS transporter [Bacillus circulans]|jgi:MFS transporter, DHA3 family, macrolide efflux protein|uniref:MFS transporter n=1 Tax=Niallia TaxID=2837506 RepID=UPI00156195C9|nr:MFS transporter [Niallia circulans]NRG26791.1 MFS transporter [Niallia circulans]
MKTTIALNKKQATFHLWTITFSNFISSFGSQIYSFIVSFSILQLTGSASSFAMNLLCGVLPRIITAPFAGSFTDRFSRKKIVIFSYIATSLTIFIMLISFLTLGLNLPFLYLGTALFSLTATFSDIGFNASISGLIDKERIQRSVSLNSSFDSIAAIISPVLGGVLYQFIPIYTFLVIYMITTVIVIILQLSMNFNLYSIEKAIKETGKKETIWQNMYAGLLYVKTKPVIISIVSFSMVANLLGGAFGIGYSFVLINNLSMSSQVFGLIESAFAVGMLITSIYLSIRPEINYPLLVTKFGANLMGLILIIFALPVLFHLSSIFLLVYYFILMLLLGIIQIFVNTPINVMLQTEVEDEYKGRVFSIIRTGAQSLVPIGTILFGFLFDWLPAYWVFGISGLFLILTSLYFARPTIVRQAYPDYVGRRKQENSTTVANSRLFYVKKRD